MPWTNWEIFTERWLRRAKRRHKYVDDGDRFISLWIAFNGWMRGQFGEHLSDTELLDRVKELTDFKNVFCELKNNNPDFSTNLSKLREYSVANMRYVGDMNKIEKSVVRYDETFESLIKVIYQVRCNLFHGRKNIDEDRKDYALVCLSYKILLPLFNAYLLHS